MARTCKRTGGAHTDVGHHAGRIRSPHRPPTIPPATRRELGAPATPGNRHSQIERIVPSLLGQGFSPDDIFVRLRSMYASDVPDHEIADFISWATRKDFRPCTPRWTPSRWSTRATSRLQSPPNPVASIKSFLRDFTADGTDLSDVSPWRPLEDWRFDSLMFLAGMFHAGERVNVMTDYKLDDDGKAKPIGWGRVMERDELMRSIRDTGTPQSEAGAWVRLNPIDGKPAAGAHGWTDANITAHRFALVEFDTVPLDLQLSLLARLPLPVNAIVLSGGRSAHGIIRVNAPDADIYRHTVSEMLSLLARFGVDQGNKNPSRMCRLPGALRKTGTTGDAQQRLLYLAPDRTDCNPIFRG